MADNPWDQFQRAPQAQPLIPGRGAAPPAGYQVAPGGLAPISGGPQDPNIAARIAAAESAARAGASVPIETAGQIAAARARAAIELNKEAQAREAERQFKLQKTPQQQQFSNLANDEVLAAIQQARNDISAGNSTGLASQVMTMFGGTNARNLQGSLNTVASRLTLDKLGELKANSPTGASGLGSLTEREGMLLRDSVAGLDQAQTPERLLENLAAVERHYRRYAALTSGEDPSNEEVATRYGIVNSPSSGGGNGGGGPISFSTNGMRSVDDPIIGGLQSEISNRISNGQSADEIRGYLNNVEPGLGDRAKGLDQAVRYHAQNPQLPIGVQVNPREIPLSDTRNTLNSLAQSGVGAYAMSAADALTAGFLDNATENPALARAGMAEISRRNAVPSVLGALTGGALAGSVAGPLAAGAGRFAPLAADIGYGAAYGAGSTDEGSRLTGALQGGAIGLGGGIAGRALARGVGNAFSGIRDADVQALRQREIPMSFGQMVGNSGTVGRYLRGREDRLAGFSGVGDMIRERQLESLRGFNRSAFDEGLSPIGANTGGVTGAPGIDLARSARGQAYDNALSGVSLTPDAQYGQAIQGVRTAVEQLPADMAQRGTYALNRVAEGLGVQADGQAFQQGLRRLRRASSENINQPNGYDLSTYLGDAETALMGLAGRQAPGAVPALAQANAANRNVSILQDAVNRARNGTRSGEVQTFTPSQLNDAAAANARRFGGTQGTTSQPFYDLTTRGQSVLPARVPDSGSAGRIEQNGGLTATGRAVLRNAVNSPLYAEWLQPALSSALLDRPDWARRTGDFIVNRANLGRMFGRGIAPVLAF